MWWQVNTHGQAFGLVFAIDQWVACRWCTAKARCTRRALLHECRAEQTKAIHEMADKERAIAKALRNPTTYTSAMLANDTVNACIVMWNASEDFAATMQCINDAAPTM
jgi:hypothetical protein